MATAVGSSPKVGVRRTKANGQASALKTLQATAWEYIEQGFYPIPLQPRSSKPTRTGLLELRIRTPEDVLQYFDARTGGIGLLLGAPEGEQSGLVDIDLDCPEALNLADQLLPTTDYVSGRRSNPASHRFYRATAPYPTTEKFKDPFWQEGSEEHETIVELRGTKNDGGVGYWALVFPSLHESGEQIQFARDNGPDLVDAAELRNAVARLAAASLLLRHWPTTDPYETRVALAGMLADISCTEEETVTFIVAVASATPKKVTREVRSTYKLKAEDKPYTAATKLAELLGEHGKKIVKTIHEWLGEEEDLGGATLTSPQFHISAVITEPFVESLEAAMAENPLIYQQGPWLLQVCKENKVYEEDDPFKRPLGNTFLSPMTKYDLALALNNTGKVYKKTKNKKSVAANTPLAWCEYLLAQSKKIYNRKWLRIEALRNVPFLLPDGDLVCEPGYHTPTRIYLDLRGHTFPPIPDKPTAQEAKEALAAFEPLFCKFDFVSVAGEPWNLTPGYAVVLSAILSILARNLVSTVPLHCASANDRGCVKTDLGKSEAIVATGSEPAILGYVNMEEFEKHLPACFIAGDRVIQIDNIDKMLRSELLDRMTTQPSGKPEQVRILGVTKKVDVENHAVIMANGNDLKIFGDMDRRALLTELNPNCDYPEERQFPFNPVERAHKMFPKLAVAGLTALRWYLQAGCPRPDYGKLGMPLDFGSFEHWVRIVRGLLVQTGYADPMATLKQVRASNPQRGDRIALMEALSRLPKKGFTVAEIAAMARTPGSSANEAYDLLCMVDKNGRRNWNSWSAAYRLTSLKGRRIGDKQLVVDGVGTGNKMKYRVEEVS